MRGQTRWHDWRWHALARHPARLRSYTGKLDWHANLPLETMLNPGLWGPVASSKSPRADDRRTSGLLLGAKCAQSKFKQALTTRGLGHFFGAQSSGEVHGSARAKGPAGHGAARDPERLASLLRRPSQPACAVSGSRLTATDSEFLLPIGAQPVEDPGNKRSPRPGFWGSNLTAQRCKVGASPSRLPGLQSKQRVLFCPGLLKRGKCRPRRYAGTWLGCPAHTDCARRLGWQWHGIRKAGPLLRAPVGGSVPWVRLC